MSNALYEPLGINESLQNLCSDKLMERTVLLLLKRNWCLSPMYLDPPRMDEYLSRSTVFWSSLHHYEKTFIKALIKELGAESRPVNISVLSNSINQKYDESVIIPELDNGILTEIETLLLRLGYL